MKSIIYCSIIILALAGGILAQKHKESPDNVPEPNNSAPQAAKNNKQSKVHSDANGAGNLVLNGTRVDGTLQNSLDVKHSKIGDPVLLKTTRDIKQDGRTVIAKGSTLGGRVTEVAQRTKQNGTSRLGMVFDRVQGRNLDMPVTASIVSLTQAATRASVADVGDFDMSGSSSSSGSVSRSGSSGGSLLGGGSGGGLLNGAGNTVGGVTSGVSNTAGGVVNTTQQTVGGVTSGGGNTTGSVLNAGNGIQIFNSGSTSASAGNGSVLASSNQNIRLEKGSTLGLELTSSSSASASRRQ